MKPLMAVLTGDLIGSSAMARERVELGMSVLAQAAGEIGDDTRFTRFRGDGWQIVLDNAGDGLWAALFLFACLRSSQAGLDTRVSIGLGTVSWLGTSDLAGSSGAAFEASGHGLDTMPKGAVFALHAQGRDARLSRSVIGLQRALVDFSADRASRWSREQAEAMAMALHPDAPTHAEIARRLGVTRQAVDSRLAAAGRNLLDAACHAIVDHFAPAPAGTAP